MKAVRIHQFGDKNVMKWEEVDIPSPHDSQVLVKIAAAGVNYIDVYQRTGHYPVSLPYTLGLEAAGVVAAVGPNVSDFLVGDRVAFTGVSGSYAEYAVVPAEKLVRVPQNIDLQTAAACMLQGMTAHYLVYSTYALKPDDTCLVHAAAGGVGLLLVQMAKHVGARVLATVSTPQKAEFAREAGADEIILYRNEDFEQRVKALTANKGVQVVYDAVGKDTFLKGINCLAPRGMMVLYGQSSGPVAPFDPAVLAQNGSLFLTRPVLFHYIADKESLRERSSSIFDLIERQKLHIRVSETFPMAEVQSVHQKLEGRQTTGKVLLIP